MKRLLPTLLGLCCIADASAQLKVQSVLPHGAAPEKTAPAVYDSTANIRTAATPPITKASSGNASCSIPGTFTPISARSPTSTSSRKRPPSCASTRCGCANPAERSAPRISGSTPFTAIPTVPGSTKTKRQPPADARQWRRTFSDGTSFRRLPKRAGSPRRKPSKEKPSK